ncbi:MAG TPA: type II toxin-antitoxin system RelE/ParE family toxin [Pyrinomonadaceae bacterium]|nr:type II toxin-antitoxin system RelE/ParE family toxin [Pyrinomonadaceae bacterium]
MAKAELSGSARYDLWDIYAYYAEQADIAIADEIRDELLGRFRLLAQHRLIGSPRFHIYPEMRAFPHKKFVIFYLPTDFGVEILRVIHSARDIESMTERDFVN